MYKLRWWVDDTLEVIAKHVEPKDPEYAESLRWHRNIKDFDSSSGFRILSTTAMTIQLIRKTKIDSKIYSIYYMLYYKYKQTCIYWITHSIDRNEDNISDNGKMDRP